MKYRKCSLLFHMHRMIFIWGHTKTSVHFPKYPFLCKYFSFSFLHYNVLIYREKKVLYVYFWINIGLSFFFVLCLFSCYGTDKRNDKTVYVDIRHMYYKGSLLTKPSAKHCIIILFYILIIIIVMFIYI